MIKRWEGIFHWLIDELPHLYHSLGIWVRFDRSNIVHFPMLFLTVSSAYFSTYNLIRKIWNTIRRHLFASSPCSVEGIFSLLVAIGRMFVVSRLRLTKIIYFTPNYQLLTHRRNSLHFFGVLSDRRQLCQLIGSIWAQNVTAARSNTERIQIVTRKTLR